jgi:hypothetical protein
MERAANYCFGVRRFGEKKPMEFVTERNTVEQLLELGVWEKRSRSSFGIERFSAYDA